MLLGFVSRARGCHVPVWEDEAIYLGQPCCGGQCRAVHKAIKVVHQRLQLSLPSEPQPAQKAEHCDRAYYSEQPVHIQKAGGAEGTKGSKDHDGWSLSGGTSHLAHIGGGHNGVQGGRQVLRQKAGNVQECA